MSVLRKYNPTTEQWEILQGGVQGVQGTPASLTKGTVTTGAPGTNANFTVTGTPPNQKLNLTIPQGAKGDTGNPSTYLIVGPGRPDLPATTGGIITGSEPVGAEYRSTDGAGVGAWAWMKRGTRWVVTSGDTGYRAIRVDDTWPEYPPNTVLKLRRIGETVTAAPGGVIWYQDIANTGANGYTLPEAGFKPDSKVFAEIYDGLSNPITRIGTAWAGSSNGRLFIKLNHDATSLMSFELRWNTEQEWPTILPGYPG